MTTQDHITAYQKGQESYDVLLTIARSIRSVFITESQACIKLLQREFPNDGAGYAMAHPAITPFTDAYNGYVESVSVNDYTVTITQEQYSSDAWKESESVSIALFVAPEDERNAMIQRIINDRFHARVQELRAAPIKAAADKEAKERAEYERLRVKYGETLDTAHTESIGT